MIVKIRFGRGRSVTRRAGKNARMALAGATLGTLGAISCATLGVWRLGKDLGWAGDFAFDEGVLSHWQVWLSAAAVIEYGSWKLGHYGRQHHERRLPFDETEKTDSPAHVRATANT